MTIMKPKQYLKKCWTYDNRLDLYTACAALGFITGMWWSELPDMHFYLAISVVCMRFICEL